VEAIFVEEFRELLIICPSFLWQTPGPADWQSFDSALLSSPTLHEIDNSKFAQETEKKLMSMMKNELKKSRLPVLALFLTLGLNAALAHTWYVNGQSGNDSNQCTSPAAACKTIGHAISHSISGDSIAVAAGTYKQNLTIGFNLTIVGANARTTFLDGGHAGSTVTISSATAHVNLAELTIRNGYGRSNGGGGIYNRGTLSITNVTVSGNTSDDIVAASAGLGGGIYNSGTLAVVQTTVSGNTVTRARMGAVPYGGGVYNTGKLTITNSTIASNQAFDNWPSGAPYGGGIANVGGTVSISSSTISQNSALIHTPFGTAGAYGGGISNPGNTGVKMQNSILASNTSGGNCSGTIGSLGFNLSSDATCKLNGPGDQKSINPQLGALLNNGGPTSTMAIAAGSPAIDAGNPSGCTDGSGHLLTTDQRSVARPRNSCDIGSFQR